MVKYFYFKSLKILYLMTKKIKYINVLINLGFKQIAIYVKVWSTFYPSCFFYCGIYFKSDKLLKNVF